MDKILSKAYQKAKAAGRICQNCGWLITVKWWRAGHRKYCEDCEDALKGVNIDRGSFAASDDVPEWTGEHI